MKRILGIIVAGGLAAGAVAQVPSSLLDAPGSTTEGRSRSPQPFARLGAVQIPTDGMKDGIASIEHLGTQIIVQTRSGDVDFAGSPQPGRRSAGQRGRRRAVPRHAPCRLQPRADPRHRIQHARQRLRPCANGELRWDCRLVRNAIVAARGRQRRFLRLREQRQIAAPTPSRSRRKRSRPRVATGYVEPRIRRRARHRRPPTNDPCFRRPSLAAGQGVWLGHRRAFVQYDPQPIGWPHGCRHGEHYAPATATMWPVSRKCVGNTRPATASKSGRS